MSLAARPDRREMNRSQLDGWAKAAEDTRIAWARLDHEREHLRLKADHIQAIRQRFIGLLESKPAKRDAAFSPSGVKAIPGNVARPENETAPITARRD